MKCLKIKSNKEANPCTKQNMQSTDGPDNMKLKV